MMERIDRKLGFLSALPLGIILVLSFLAPMVVVALFSIMPPKVFDLAHIPNFAAYSVFFDQGYYKSLLWSLGMALASTAILFVICWPLAYGMAKVFGRFSLILTIAVVMSLFVSENIRLFGWVLTLMKGGLFEGHLRALTGIGFDSPLYNTGIIIFGLVYVYLPFMLFPLAQGISMVPDDARQAAADLGATRWQILRQIDLPLAAPGIMVGSLLSFVLAAGALAESKILGGQAVIVIADDIETAFTFGQNWPLGAALSMILIVIIGGLAIFGVNRIDLDAIMGRKR
ncbi:Spermidine/putrescine transport system permease protein PotB [Roseovarius aestuarii]|uniref:Spermidine/putrescine transport system permease protein PotB n=2 Tax=Roseovarius aestuarii TaxID=475083 RepID=A0A1X7BPF5_9RHOB|nr:Spermidine/putrescine transport system permease protein PotB [Roseovarius aestuarii]